MGKLYSTASPPKKLPTAIFSATNESAIGVDVHLDKMVFCYQRCQFNGDKLEQREFIYRGSRDELRKAAKICFSLQPNVIVMESTGIYWLSLYEMLEDAGFNSDQLIVLNAREVKAARGRKTDYTDALRLTEVGRSGNYKASFIQDKQHRQYRLCFRAMQNTRKHKQRAVNQLHKLLCSVGVRASTVFSDIRGKAASNIICALAAGKDGKKPMRVILAHNLLRIIFAMIRDGSHFKNSKTDLLDQFRIRKLEKAVNDMSKTNCLVEGALVVKDKLTGTINTTIDPQKQPKCKKKCVGAAF